MNLTEKVSRSRLANGQWDQKKDSPAGQGDITAAYSADKIASEGRIRPPFSFGGLLWSCVSIGPSSEGAKAYRVTELKFFAEETTTYNKKSAPGHGEAARRDPNGFYHGMVVKCGGKEFVLTGPPVDFLPDSEAPTEQPAARVGQQANLFGD